MISVHGIAAAMARTPEIALEPEQANALAARLADVNKFYPMPVIKPEHVAIGALIVTAMPIYAGMYQAVAARKASGVQRKSEASATAPVAPLAPGVAIGTGSAPVPDWFAGEIESRPN